MESYSPFGFSASFRISSMVLTPLGISSMQGSTTFSVNEHQPESLRSVGITRLQCCAGGNNYCAGGNKRYYTLIRLPMQPRRSYAFLRKVGRNRNKPRICQQLMPPICPPHGISQVSDFTFDTRCSQPPRIARQLHLPVASLPMIDFAFSGRLVAIKKHNEAESPCFQKTRTDVAADVFARTNPTPADCSTKASSDYMSNRQFT
jgi:hypothetical protein